MATVSINIRVDEKLKKQAEALFSELGLNMSSAITVFLKSSVDYNGIPFEIRKTERYLAVGDAELLTVSNELLDKNKEPYRVLAK
ncbi:MAG: type II toxin-antitoxin system RelB/DinJ family antitoxin [Clostridia bacterium]|nr:type II toxin-antitoxin system RelB/DinJ family antitoxin [Clostridia bacterium]